MEEPPPTAIIRSGSDFFMASVQFLTVSIGGSGTALFQTFTLNPICFMLLETLLARFFTSLSVTINAFFLGHRAEISSGNAGMMPRFGRALAPIIIFGAMKEVDNPLVAEDPLRGTAVFNRGSKNQ